MKESLPQNDTVRPTIQFAILSLGIGAYLTEHLKPTTKTTTVRRVPFKNGFRHAGPAAGSIPKVKTR